LLLWLVAIGLALLALTGVGPLLAWRKSTVRNLFDQFLWPVLFAFVVSGALVAMGVRVWSSGICFALCAFVFGTIGQEFIRGAEVRQAATGTDKVTAMIGLVARSKRRYGGYIVHVGIALMFLGFAGEGFKQEGEALLRPGQEFKVAHFTIKHDALRVTSDAQKQMITGHVSVYDDGRLVGTMEPAKWFYAKREQEPTTEVAIRRGISEDFYIVLAGYDAAEQSATYAVTVNPLVNWIWLGFGIMALGTGLALLPETALAFATTKVPSGAATASMILLLLLVPSVMSAQAPDATRAVLRKQLEGEILCTCSCRRPMNDCPMEPNCHGLDAQRAKLDKYVLEQGMDRDQVLAAFAADYGTQAILARPIDKGFNRLAWFFPYLVGIAGAFAAVVIARRWSRVPAETSRTAAREDDQALRTRLDDELRDLD
jgi:cytochrome c-type biogenesis protein CcmF